MTPATLDSAALDRVREELQALDGVRRAFVEGPPYTVYVVADRPDSGPTDMLVHSVLARHGISASDASVETCHPAAAEPRRRIRFVSVSVTVPRAGRAVGRVELEWNGRTFAHEMEGESGPALELRLAALATLGALGEVLEGQIAFQLLGIKPVRAFDADVVVALVKANGDARSLIGAALAAGDPFRSASLAVLNATNRVLGNYLHNLE